jgi:hypothetical protein
MFRIRPLRLANFRGVLEQLAEEEAHNGESGIGRVSSDRLAGCWRTPPLFPFQRDDIGPPAERSRRSGGVFHAYEEAAASSARAPRDELPCRKSDEEQVAEELCLTQGLTPAELRRRRRDFAIRHHPDCVPEPFRERATRRMSIANALVDGALRRP